jgi:formate C-acetyltransferase
MEYAVLQICLASNAGQLGRGLYSPNPYRSCLIEGCLEKGVDYRNGGPLYNHGQILGEAIADAGDSLWAVKKLVYDQKKYTMAELVKALDDNFVGHDQLYYDFSHCEKFGNDCAEVDEITAKFINRCFELFNRTKTYRGGYFSGGCSPYNRAANVGRALGALPSGHKKGDPIIADCIGAHPGCDVNGPTSLIKSVLNFNHVLCGSGFVLQAKFDKKIFNSTKGKQAFIALVKTFFACGGQQYTATVVSKEDLIDAKAHPELHRDLIVRVGGYSDYFVNLDEGLQDNIIARTNTEL